MVNQSNMVVQLQPAYIEFNFPILIMREDVEVSIYFGLIITAAFHDLGITLFYLKIKPYSMLRRITVDYLRGFFHFEHWPSFDLNLNPQCPVLIIQLFSMKARMAYILKHFKNSEYIAERAKIMLPLLYFSFVCFPHLSFCWKIVKGLFFSKLLYF